MSSESRSPAEWAAVLSQIEESLAAAEAALARREAAVTPLGDPVATTESAADELLRRLEREGDVVAGLAFFTKRAQDSVKEAAGTMREREMAMEDWLARAACVRQRLADWDTGSLR